MKTRERHARIRLITPSAPLLGALLAFNLSASLQGDDGAADGSTETNQTAGQESSGPNPGANFDDAFNIEAVSDYYELSLESSANIEQVAEEVFGSAEEVTPFGGASILEGPPTGIIVPNVLIEFFFNPTVEHFDPPTLQTDNHDFGNGLVFTNLDGDLDYVRFQNSYGLGENGEVTAGIDNDGFFGTLEPQTTFQFAFGTGVVAFGFYGTEALFQAGDPRDGILDLSFYGTDDSLLGFLSVDTNGGTAFDTFHGFLTTGILIGKVVFENAGHVVLDDVTYTSTVIPEPESAVLLLIGIVPVLALRRRNR